MLSKLLGLFRGRGVLIQGAARLPEGQSKRVALGDVLAGGREIVLCRVGGTLYALDRRCPHEGGRIHDGPLFQGKYAVCPLHNYKFDPATGKAFGVACKDATTYRVTEENGDARVYGAH
jgi:nitrite reductase/ring-hydroxylating ferredoxin subunit